MKNRSLYFLILSFIFSVQLYAQEIPVNEYGLPVVDDVQLYFKMVQQDSSQLLVDLEDIMPNIVLDIVYATDDNFSGKKQYTMSKAYLRKAAAEALMDVQNDLMNNHDIAIKVFDAYRPYAVTIQFWEPIQDSRYVASPQYGSRHNRGCAVDLTLIDLETEEELPMPTEFDDFTEKAHHDYMDLPENVLKNRAILKNTMEKYGFLALDSEWWHYDFKGYKNYPVMDISFEDLKEIE